MPSFDFVKSVEINRSARVMQLEGLFEIAPAAKSEARWKGSLAIEERNWNIGLIVGASGSGKTSIAKELFADKLISDFKWATNKAIIDCFPASMSIKEIAALLSSVGFSSPPNWLRPYAVLSNGEQFRVTIARALAESPELVAIDEFTSVVDRQVAQIGSAAVAKAVRRRGQKFVAVSCHYDIVEWLQPDWMYEPATNSFAWRSLRRYPQIKLDIFQVDNSAWPIFKKHHYLDSELSRSAKCFIAVINGDPAAFTAVLPFPHPSRSGWREHRTVCLPDYQGVGIGNAMSEYIAGLFRASGKPYFSTTSNPAMIHHRARSKDWTMKRAPSLTAKTGRSSSIKALNRTVASRRITAGFEYIGHVNKEDAAAFGLRVC